MKMDKGFQLQGLGPRDAVTGASGVSVDTPGIMKVYEEVLLTP